MTSTSDTAPQDGEQVELREHVRAHYAAAARAVGDTEAVICDDSGCCSTPISLDESPFGAAQYSEIDRGALPTDAVTASLGCGDPLAVADLHEGDTVLDLGSGGGIDVLLSARRIGPTGTAYGLDMTDEMLELARRNAAEAGVTNVEFLKGEIEDIPLPDASVDAVISNCVINLSADKPAVFAEAHRVLRPGGRFGVSDIVADDHLSIADRAERGSHVGCVAGCLTFGEYRDQLTAAGFTDVEVTPTHQVTDAVHAAIVRATKPTEPRPGPSEAASGPTDIPAVSRAAVADGVRNGATVLVEALPEEVFAEGHLPGAVNIRPRRCAELAPVLLPDQHADIVVYCGSASCDASLRVARHLRELGYHHVSRYVEGKEDWVSAGHILERNETP